MPRATLGALAAVVVTSTLVNLARDGHPAGRAARLARADRLLAVLALAAVVVLRAAAVASSLAARRIQQRQGAAEGRASTT